MKTFKSFFLFFILSMWAFPQSSLDNISPRTAYFISYLKDAKKNKEDETSIRKRFELSKKDNKEYINVFIDLNKDADIEILKEYGIFINTILPDIITAQIPVDKIEEIASLPEVKRIDVGVPVYQNMDEARIASNVNNVHMGNDLKTPYTGKDVIIGIIDKGFQYSHKSFFDNQGTLRIKQVWSQNGSGNKPAGFNYGTEYASQQTIVNAGYDSNNTSHGTHVAGIAGGSNKYEDNPYYGVAPESDLVLVSYNIYNTEISNPCISDGIKYIFDYAEAVGKPCVINMSLGAHIGPHDGTSSFDRICDGLQGEGKLLVGGVGNEGNKDVHISKNFTQEGEILQSFLAFKSSSDRYGEADIWSESGKSFEIQVVIYKKSNATELFATPIMDASLSDTEEFTLDYSQHGAKGKIRVITETNPINNKSNAYIVADLSAILTGNYVGIKIISKQQGTVNAWADNIYSYFSGNGVEGWVNGNSTSSLSEIGGTGNRIISVGAFTSKNKYTDINGMVTNTGQELGNIADFSSNGPSIDGRIKPDITAPGSIIVSSYSDALSYSSNIVMSNNINDRLYYYAAMEGTSMAAPHVTGILATWLEAKNDLTPEDIREILKKTAMNDSFTGNAVEEPNNIWGYGKIDAWAGIKEIENMIANSIESNDTEFPEWKIYPNPVISGNVNLYFPDYSKSTVIINIHNLNGIKIHTQKINLSSPAYNMNIEFLPKGAYLISVQNDQSYQTKKLIVL